jgi:hypothetical protein
MPWILSDRNIPCGIFMGRCRRVGAVPMFHGSSWPDAFIMEPTHHHAVFVSHRRGSDRKFL